MNSLKGYCLKMAEDTQNLTTQYRKASRRGLKFISYMFNLNVKLDIIVMGTITGALLLPFCVLVTEA